MSEKTENLECNACGSKLNQIQEPRVYDDDLDPRRVGEDEYCYDCWSSNFEHCLICKEVDRDDLCDHLFYDLEGNLNGPGRDGITVDYAEKHFKPIVQRLIRECANQAIFKAVNDSWVDETVTRTFILDTIEKIAEVLEDNNLIVRVSGSIFSIDRLEFDQAVFDRTRPNVYWLVPSTRLYEKRNLTHDGVCWMRHIGEPETAEWNKLTAGWLREIKPHIEAAHNRYLRLHARKQEVVNG